jgi:hypothetical protein
VIREDGTRSPTGGVIMAELVMGGETVEASEVPIEESTERWTEIKLADGAVLRIKLIVGAVYRIEGKTDPDGNPMYAVKSTNHMVIVSGPSKPAGKDH